MSIEQRKIRQFRCKNCGGELELQNPRTRFVACPYCGSVADATSDAFHVLTKYANPSDFPPRSFIKLGKEAKILNKAYKVIGRTRWKSEYWEHWYEEGEQGYEKGNWVYDEWLLISEDATYFYIIEDQEGYYFSFSITPPFPSLPANKKIQDFYDKNTIHNAKECGNSKIVFFEGESTYLVKPGRIAGFSEYETYKGAEKDNIYLQSGVSYIAEWRYNDEGEIQEIEFFKEQKVKASQLKYAFMTDEERLALEQKQKAALLSKQKVRKTNKNIFKYAAWINILIGLVLMIMYSGAKYNFKPVLNQEFKIPQPLTEKDFIIKDSTKIVSFTPSDIIEVKPGSVAAKISIRPEIPQESDVLFRLQIYNAETNDLVFEKSTYAYDYKHYKGDRTAYANGNFEETFALNNSEGKYKVKFEMELPLFYAQKPTSGDKPKAKVEISIKEKYSPDGFGLLIIGLMFLIISFFIKVPKLTE